MIAYKKLHAAGYAHSVETYYRDELAGGLYGVSLGRVFFGESMFYLIKDASKVALYYLVEKLISWDFDLIDAQQSTSHLKSLGAEEISRKKFLEVVKRIAEERDDKREVGNRPPSFKTLMSVRLIL